MKPRRLAPHALARRPEAARATSLILVPLLASVLALGCAARGERAIERMSPDQREFIAHGLTSFTPRTTPADLDAAFGSPVEPSAGHRAWHRAGAPVGERIEAWFEGDRLVRLRIFDRGCATAPSSSCAPGWIWELVAQGDRLVSVAPISPLRR